jgi:MFS family permease
MLLSLAAAKFICGSLSDVLGAKFINMLCMICSTVGLVMLTMVNSIPMAIAACVVFSIGTVMTTITVPLLSSALFGYKPQGTIIGILMALVPAASVVTSPVVNMLYDRIGSYSPIFLGTAVIGAAVTVLMVPLFIMTGRDRKQHESVQCNKTEETL